MHTVELLEQAVSVATQLGYQIRYEWLGGIGGGGCLIKGEKWIFLDLAQTPIEQLGQVIEAIRTEPNVTQLDLTGELNEQIAVRKSA